MISAEISVPLASCNGLGLKIWDWDRDRFLQPAQGLQAKTHDDVMVVVVVMVILWIWTNMVGTTLFKY